MWIWREYDSLLSISNSKSFTANILDILCFDNLSPVVEVKANKLLARARFLESHMPSGSHCN